MKVIKYSGAFQQCPRCWKNTMVEPIGANALSRRDNSTMICNNCGTEESLVDWANSTGIDIPIDVQDREVQMQKVLKEQNNVYKK